MDMSAVNLIVATPCFGGMVTQRYMLSTLALLQTGTQAGFRVGLELLGYESLVQRGRNTLVARFLDNPAATHLLFVDADIGFGLPQLARMLRLDEDVVAGMYPLKQVDWDAGARVRAQAGEALGTAPLRYVGTPCEGAALETRDGFVTGVYAGTGFMLIKRAVLLRMIDHYPELRYTAAHTAARPDSSPHLCALFECVIDPTTREYLSEDYAFCQRWRAMGGRIWLDTEGVLTHVGPHEFVGAPALRF